MKLYLMNEREVSKQVPRSWQNLFGMLGSKTLPETVETKALLATVDIGNEFLSGDSEYGAPGREVPKLYRGKRLHLVVTVGSGVFIKLCTDVLDQLRTRFEKHNGISGYEVIYDYVVE